MPAKPTNAENAAPTRKNTDRPIRDPVVSAGRMNSRAKMMTANGASVVN